MNYQKNTTKFGKKVKNSLKKEFVGEPVCNKKYLEAKIKSFNRKINTNFYDNKGSQFICLSVILIDSDFGTCKNYYPRVLLEE